VDPVLITGAVGAAAFLVALGRVMLGNRVRPADCARTIRSTPRLPIRDLVPETVKVVGRLEMIVEPLIAPMSRRPCAFWEVVVEEVVGAGAGAAWVTRVSQSRGVDFDVRDESGRVRVELGGVAPASAMVPDREFITGLRVGAPGPKAQEWLRRRKISLDNVRYRESILAAGERVAVVGTAHRERDPDAVASGAYRDAAPTRWVLRGPLAVTDDPRLIGSAPRDERPSPSPDDPSSDG